MTIKSHIPWPLRVAIIGFMVVIGTAVVMWTYDLSRSAAIGGPDRQQLMETLDELGAERDRLSSAVNASESRLNMERAAQRQLAAQVRSLEAENIRLKEDLAFFESLLPANTGAPGVAIRRLKVDVIGPNQLRYRLLVMQGGKASNHFVGSLQLVVTVVQEGKSAMIIFPEGNSGEAERVRFKLGFRHYQHLDGILTLPEGSVVKSVQARVLEKGQIRAQQSVNL
jgi:hypothetical protein